jgi:hypothetical protein
MIPNEVLAAWIVAATIGAAALGGLSLLDNRHSPSGVEAEPLPFYYPDISMAPRLPPPDNAWRSRWEATGSLPTNPTTLPADQSEAEVDEMEHKDRSDKLWEEPLATADEPPLFQGP